MLPTYIVRLGPCFCRQHYIDTTKKKKKEADRVVDARPTDRSILTRCLCLSPVTQRTQLVSVLYSLNILCLCQRPLFERVRTVSARRALYISATFWRLHRHLNRRRKFISSGTTDLLLAVTVNPPFTSWTATRNFVLPSLTVLFNNVVACLSSARLRVVAPHSSENQTLVFQGAEALCPCSDSQGHFPGVGGLHASAECCWWPSGCYGDCRGASPFFSLVSQRLIGRLLVRDRRLLGTKAMLPS